MRGKYCDSPAQLLVQRAYESLRYGPAVIAEQRQWQVDVDDLGKGVHASVGATGTHDDRLFDLQCVRERLAKDADDRRELRLIGEAGKRVAVVGDVQTPPLDD